MTVVCMELRKRLLEDCKSLAIRLGNLTTKNNITLLRARY
jgi:hypothetical protein